VGIEKVMKFNAVNLFKLYFIKVKAYLLYNGSTSLF